MGCAHFFSDIQLVGNRQRDFYQAFNIELVFVHRFPTESNYSPPLRCNRIVQDSLSSV